MKHTLANGLRIVIEERRKAPVVAMQMWVQVGSADEQPSQAGLAHVHEHMLFKGTERRGVGEIAREVEAAGGEINAWTAFDQTVYHIVMASRYWERGLDVLADAIQRPVFDAQELEREREVILEEYRSARDLPSREVSRRLLETAFRAHPYGRPVIGTLDRIQSFSRDDVLAFYRQWYLPANMVLSVAGDVDTDELLAAANRLFGAWSPAGEPSARSRAAEPEQQNFRAVVGQDHTQEAHLGLAFPVPGVEDDDVPALDVLAILLGQGETSRLNTEVKRRRQLVHGVHAYTYTPKDPGLFLVGAALNPERLEGAMSGIMEQIFRLHHEPVRLDELRKARTMVEADTIFQRETAQGGARKLGYWESVMNDLAGEQRYLEQVRQVTPQDIQRVATRYLQSGKLSVSVLVPAEGDQPPTEESILALVQKAETRVAVRLAVPELKQSADGVVKLTLENGLTLLVRQDRTVPVVALRAVFPGGLRYETQENSGTHNFLAELLTQGTKTRSADQLAEVIDGMAGSLAGFSGRNSLGLAAEFLSRDFTQGLELFSDCLLRPTFPDDEVEKHRSLVLDEIRAQEDHLAGLVFREFNKAMFGEHPYHMDVLGTSSSVSRLDGESLRRHYARYFGPGRATLSIVGDVELAAVVKDVRRLFSDSSGVMEQPPVVGAWKPSEGAQLRVVNRDRAQAHLVLGFPGTTIDHRDRNALEVLSTVLGGQGGRLFVELRERKGLAYSVTTVNLEGVDPGYFAVYAAISPEKLDESVRSIRAVLQGVIEKPVSEEELQRARTYLVGVHDIALQRISSLASQMAFDEAYGLGYDAYRGYADGILGVSSAQVQDVARRYLVAKHEVLAVVAPEGTTDGLAGEKTSD